MAAPPRSGQQGTFFITTVCAERHRVFQTDDNARLLFDVLQHYRSIYRLHAFVIMPEHLHLLLTPLLTLERAMQCIKGGFSRQFHAAGKRQAVWQRGFVDHRVRDRVDFDLRKGYLEANPVTRGLVSSAEMYRWSSAYQKKADLSG